MLVLAIGDLHIPHRAIVSVKPNIGSIPNKQTAILTRKDRTFQPKYVPFQIKLTWRRRVQNTNKDFHNSSRNS